MTNIPVLNVSLHNQEIGTLTRLGGDKLLFAFTDNYIDDPNRPTLGLHFKDPLGELITDFRPTQTRVSPYFANLLPEGHLREYLAKQAGVNPQRDFPLLWAFGLDLPGAVRITSAEDEPWPGDRNNGEEARAGRENVLRFSLAGVQLKFSAVADASGGLKIPVEGIGGHCQSIHPCNKLSFRSIVD